MNDQTIPAELQPTTVAKANVEKMRGNGRGVCVDVLNLTSLFDGGNPYEDAAFTLVPMCGITIKLIAGASAGGEVPLSFRHDHFMNE